MAVTGALGGQMTDLESDDLLNVLKGVAANADTLASINAKLDRLLVEVGYLRAASARRRGKARD